MYSSLHLAAIALGCTLAYLACSEALTGTSGGGGRDEDITLTIEGVIRWSSGAPAEGVDGVLPR
jgi:hypothetical protein